MPNLMSTGYGGGASTTSTQGNPYTLPGPSDFFNEMVNRRYVREKPTAVRERAAAIPRQPAVRTAPGKPAWQDELDKLKAFDQYEATLRGAATRPVGLGAQMIPGMAVDERLLPQRLRAQSAVGGQLFQDAGPSGGQAGPSPSFASGVGSTPGQYGSGSRIETGLDYMPPAEKARWSRLLGQG